MYFDLRLDERQFPHIAKNGRLVFTGAGVLASFTPIDRDTFELRLDKPAPAEIEPGDADYRCESGAVRDVVIRQQSSSHPTTWCCMPSRWTVSCSRTAA